jgi:Tfp pilus assembly protein PilO
MGIALAVMLAAVVAPAKESRPDVEALRVMQEKEIARLEQKLGPLMELDGVRRDLQMRDSVLGRLASARGDGAAHLLDDVAASMPKNASLKSITWSRGETLVLTLAKRDASAAQALASSISAKGCADARVAGLTIVCAPAHPAVLVFHPAPAVAKEVSEDQRREDRFIHLTAIASDRAQWAYELEVLRKHLVSRRESIPDLANVEEMKQQVGKRLNGFPYELEAREAERVDAGFVEAIPLRWKFTGSYVAVGVLLDTLDKLRRFTSFTSLSIANPREAGGQTVVDATAGLEIYRYKPEVAGASEPLTPFDVPTSIYAFSPAGRDPFR